MNNDMIYRVFDEDGNMEYRYVNLEDLNISEMLTLKKELELTGEDGERMIESVLYGRVNYSRLLGSIRREERTSCKTRFNDPKAFVKKRKKLHKR